MKESKISASGERAAIGGYLPQYDEFAWFVYLNLNNKKLEWIRIADPNAEKLDDIQYSTYSEIHAFQVKWTIADQKISFADFSKLLPSIVSSWKVISSTNSNKKTIPHLLTNKALSTRDSIFIKKSKIGSFNDFYLEVWQKMKSGQSYDKKWNPVVSKIKAQSKLDNIEFQKFVQDFDFQPNYKQKKFGLRIGRNSKENEDLQKVSRFIIEEAANPDRVVEFSRQQIINKLGWADRFRTIFNHDLVIDRQKYQPIKKTIDALNLKLKEHKNGYLFLLGGPGTGKSTLLNQWSKSLDTRVVSYYAFDFVNPSSQLNFHERGNATNLFYDLVFQLKESGIYKRDILPYKDLLFLKEVFSEQLKSIAEDYKSNGLSTVIIIDGLDHVPREYKSVTKSFLRELPTPDSLPEGVYIVLGSQTYELEDIRQEIKSQFLNGARTIQIDSLSKEEVYKYIAFREPSIELNSKQKIILFEKSQGHPLFLNYLLEKLIESDSIDETLKFFESIEGNIDNYYNKIWGPIQDDNNLIHFLGLIARINGPINLDFIKEWDFEWTILKTFKEKARFLFMRTDNSLSFFHNSFKQFLLLNTSLNYLTDEFDSKTDIKLHRQLAEYYRTSKLEKSWRCNYHLFQSKQFYEFIQEVTPESLISQFENFRPPFEVIKDIKLGIRIGQQNKDIKTLVRYLFLLAEIEKRLNNLDPTLFVEELLNLNKFELARDYLRTANVLHCNESYALKYSSIFFNYGHQAEGAILFNLGHPEVLSDSGIFIDNAADYENIKGSLEEWSYAAPYFMDVQEVFSRIENINFLKDQSNYPFEEKEADLFLSLITNLGYSLISQNKWGDFDIVVTKIKTTNTEGRNAIFQLFEYAIEKCLQIKDDGRANHYLALFTSFFSKEKTRPIGKIFIADLIYKVNGDTDEVFEWIKDIDQPTISNATELGYNDSLEPFVPLIKLNKLLNLSNKGIPITKAIQSATKGTDEEILVEFERMLCLITQIYTDGILEIPQTIDIINRVYPITKFFYKDISPKNSYYYKLNRIKGEYFDFLIAAINSLDSNKINVFGDYLCKEFDDNPQYWNASVQRKIVESLLKYGYNLKKATNRLDQIEKIMLEGHDVDGRITECISHSTAWMKLGENQLGEKWIKQAIRQSIGVGYRKDYQFSTWISWLKKINEKDHPNAPERIKWFLSHLNHIKETTEGRAFWVAARQLLEVTFEHSLFEGFKQMVWQIDNDLIDFNDSLYLFIKFIVNHSEEENELQEIIQLYLNLFLLLAESDYCELLNTILTKGYKLLGDDFLNKNLRSIISAININAYQENRASLIFEINEFLLSIGKNIADFYPSIDMSEIHDKKNTSKSSNTLVLSPDYKNIDENEVLDKVSTYEDFKDLIEKEDCGNSYFDWSNVIAKLSTKLSITEIEEASKLGCTAGRGTMFYAKLSEVSLQIGNTSLAKNLAIKSLECSSDYGWAKHYDGGSRIIGFKALEKVDPILSSDKAFDIFSEDILNGSYIYQYIEYLDDIGPLLKRDYKDEELWPEVFKYLKRLMSNSIIINNIPSLSSDIKPIHEVYVHYLEYLLSCPATLIKENAIILFAKCILQNNDYALTKILSGSINQDLSLEIIVSIFELDPSKAHLVLNKINELSLSKNYHIREEAKRILSALDITVSSPSRIKLPSIYSLYIPESKKPKLNISVDEYFPHIDLKDPFDCIRPFEFIVKVLSQESGINKTNIVHRIFQVMKKIGNEHEWTIEYEQKLRKHLEDIGLQYSYRRPRVTAAHKAIMQVTTELIDSRSLNDTLIKDLLIPSDSAVPFFKKIAKPPFVQTLKDMKYGGVSQNWIEKIDESNRLSEQLLKFDKSFRILAEYTKVRNLVWGLPTEEYMSQVTSNEHFKEDNKYIFGSTFHQISSRYYQLELENEPIVIIRDHQFNHFDIKSRWIAINPSLAKSLNWKKDPTQMFAWKNSKGELMAKSIYWSNGNFNWLPYKDGEVGEGWFTIISEKGLENILTRYPSLFIQKKLIRTFQMESKQFTKVLKL